jgi:hypothetical protein
MIVLNYLHYQFINLIICLARAFYRPSVVLCHYVRLMVEVPPWTN